MDDYNNFILSNYDGGTFENGDFNLRIDQGTFDLAVQFGQGNNRGIAYISDSSIGDISGKWTHIAFTCDTSRGNNEKIRAWVDGTEIAMSNQGGYEGSGNVLMDNHVHLRLGGSYVSHFHNGMIDEVGIWNRTLSTDETLKLYNNGDGWSY